MAGETDKDVAKGGGAGDSATTGGAAIEVDPDAGSFLDDDEDDLLDGYEELSLDDEEGDDDGTDAGTGDDGDGTGAAGEEAGSDQGDGDGAGDAAADEDGAGAKDGAEAAEDAQEAAPEAGEEAAEEVAEEEDDALYQGTRKVPEETDDPRILKASHKFRYSVEPLVAPIRDRLPEAIGIPVALTDDSDTDGTKAMQALVAYSESGARKIADRVLADKGLEYVAAQYKLDPAVVEERLKGEVIVQIPKVLADDIDYMSEEAQAEVHKLADSTKLAVSRAEAAEKKVTEVIKKADETISSIREEQFGELVSGDCDTLCDKLQIAGKAKEQLEERIGYAFGKRAELQDTLKKLRVAVHNGDKADKQTYRASFNRQLAALVKELATDLKGKATAAPTTAAKAKAPAAKATTGTKQGEAGSKKQTAKPPAIASKGSQAVKPAPPVKAQDGYIEDDKERLRYLLAKQKELLQKHGFTQ
jgi:hypothetical protein